ncbi:farnesyl-diphosphate synthase [Flagelloscypha sp. PMI_526]|nr:farnesyl-diphosphate synthase [Flagelloscypha sp. PMI_526]
MSSSAAKRDRFLSLWPSIQTTLLEHLKSHNMPQTAIDWYSQNLAYNTPGGKLNRGLSIPDTVAVLYGRELTDEEYEKAGILGWCVELLQAYFLVADDVMDTSITRRGQECWYRREGVGMIAINDSFMLEAAIYHLLKVHFKKESYYVDLLELFLETTFQTEMGQLIDLITADEVHVDLDKFSLEKHSKIVIYKTAFYSFYLPVALALRFAHIPDSYVSPSTGKTIEPYKTSLAILLPLGEYFQVQDDFLDATAPPEVLGKIGTDIIDNKCSWCINIALQRVSPAQRKVLDEHYGKKPSGGESEQKVQAIYEEIGLKGIYEAYEKDVVRKLQSMIETEVPEEARGVQGVLRRELFSLFMGKIVGRSK